MLESDKNITLAEAVRSRRVDLKLTQAQLAQLAGCSERFVFSVEKGKTAIRLSNLLQIMEVLGFGITIRPGDGDIDWKEPNPIPVSRTGRRKRT